jgi:hypothetical protein
MVEPNMQSWMASNGDILRMGEEDAVVEHMF